MTTTLVDQLKALPGVVAVDGATIEAFLAQAGGRAVLFFTGESKRRPEAQDVAVVLREMLRSYRSELALGVIADTAEDALRQRFGVIVLPSVVLVQGGAARSVIARIQDWSVYAAQFALVFGPARAAEGGG